MPRIVRQTVSRRTIRQGVTKTKESISFGHRFSTLAIISIIQNSPNRMKKKRKSILAEGKNVCKPASDCFLQRITLLFGQKNIAFGVPKHRLSYRKEALSSSKRGKKTLKRIRKPSENTVFGLILFYFKCKHFAIPLNTR